MQRVGLVVISVFAVLGFWYDYGVNPLLTDAERQGQIATFPHPTPQRSSLDNRTKSERQEKEIKPFPPLAPALLNSTDSFVMKQHTEPLYAWMHIPKTGGTTGYEMYMRPLQGSGNDTIYPLVRPKRPPYDWNSPGCGTHFSFGGTHCSVSEIHDCLLGRYPKRPVKFLTVLRHPVDRVISEYFWWLKKNTAVWTRSMIENEKNLTAWILDETNLAHNRQALYFLLDSPFPVSDSECKLIRSSKLLPYVQSNFGSVSRLNKDVPLSHINDTVLARFAFIGILEDAKASKTAYHHVFGKATRMGMVKIHASRKDKTVLVDKKIRALIEDHNRLDMALYRLVKNKLLLAQD